MDSYSFHFERMNNLDLHPLSLPVSRLSPAKSTSSIDQYTHHHGKGDSAYSSFSGGSSAPDYPSPFLSDDFNPHSLHYADLKYVKAVYGPSILDTDSKSMDQLYRSMEAIAHHQNHDNCPHSRDPCELSAPLTPPPPPTRLDSFETTRNLETSRARQSPEGQLADVSSFRTQTVNPETLGPRPDLVCGRRVSQHYQKDQQKQDLVDKIPESKAATVLSRLAPQTSQPERSQQTKGAQAGIQKKRSHSAYGVSVTEQQRAVSSWHMGQNTISGSIQHKGQFYFVTGVYKSPESSVQQAPCLVESSSTEPHRQAEKQGSHNTTENTFKNVQVRKPGSPEGPNGKLFFQEEKKLSTKNEDKQPAGNPVLNHSYKSDRASHSADNLEDSQSVLNMDIGRHHITNHPIFYCGPEKSFSGSDPEMSLRTTGTDHGQNVRANTDQPLNRWSRQPLADMPTEKISKENTPLLYHLTGANRTSLMNKANTEKNSRPGGRDPDWGRDKQKTEKEFSRGDSPHSEISKEQKQKDFSDQCNTLDDSFKKYYKEKLKDAQSKVLRETSFKRKDLQLSWPNRIEQRSGKRLSVVPPGPHSQDVHSKLENPVQTNLPKIQDSDKETLRNPSQEIEKQIETETKKQHNIPQPQVPRIGSRKRLTPEQKKLSHSEPEKLHQLGDRPTHMSCRSLGSESEVLLSDDSLGEHGLVATRCKMFETRGRALSASSLSKSSLKHLQHKALVAYMERKTGHKAAEPQQPAPQVPSQRHLNTGRQSDWGPRPQSANAVSKKKHHRPHSAGRILDSSSAQFTNAQQIVQTGSSGWRQGSLQPSGKCASMENLLDEQEPPASYRTSSVSTPPAYHQVHGTILSSASDISSAQISVEGEAPVYKHYAESVPDQRRARMMAPRGKSLEELGVSKVINPRALSKSTENLHQAPGQYSVSGRDTRDLLLLIEKHQRTQGELKQDTVSLGGFETNNQDALEFSKEPCSLDQRCTALHSRERASRASSSASPALEFSAQVACVPSCDDKAAGTIYGDGREDTSAPGSPKGTREKPLSVSKMKAVPQEQPSVKDEGSPGNMSETHRRDSVHEVSLSLGVTTDPSLWISPPNTDDNNTEDCPRDSASCDSQNTQRPPCAETETAHNSSDPDTESTPEVSRDQAKTEKEKKCGPVVSGNQEECGPKDRTQWEMLVQEVVSADETLARILYPVSNRKTALMLMEQLLSEDTFLMEEHYKKKQEQSSRNPEPTTDSPGITDADKVNTSLAPKEEGGPLTTRLQLRECSTGSDITEKKKQLMSRIEEQLKSLEGLRSSLQGEERENGERGDVLEALVRQCCAPAELERYTQFIGDLERVINLLLCLSARLARVQNALSTVDENTDAEEKQSLDNRHHLLCKQREDAKDLKDNLDRRERMVSVFLAKQLTDAQLQEYRRFIQTKASLLIRLKDLDEKQRLGEEQLEALTNSIPP